jgi:hypothetical protein
MSRWTSSLLCVLLLQTVQLPVQDMKAEVRPAVIEESVAATDERPQPLVFSHKDWELAQAYADVFKILSDDNSCSDFYGGPRKATIVLNNFVPLVQSHRLLKELSFLMTGSPRIIHNPINGLSYRLFDRATVNSDGSFYHRRLDSLRRFPADVGSFPPGTRQARALILLHELGHLIEGGDGAWVLPDDGHDGAQSNRNTLVVQRACRRQLETLK